MEGKSAPAIVLNLTRHNFPPWQWPKVCVHPNQVVSQASIRWIWPQKALSPLDYHLSFLGGIFLSVEMGKKN
jgi:hypothetical protein